MWASRPCLEIDPFSQLGLVSVLANDSIHSEARGMALVQVLLAVYAVGKSAQAAREVHLTTDALDLQSEAKEVQMKSTAGMISLDMTSGICRQPVHNRCYTASCQQLVSIAFCCTVMVSMLSRSAACLICLHSSHEVNLGHVCLSLTLCCGSNSVT